MRHVAAACGVSTATVSQILRDPEHPRFPQNTRERVLAAAKQLDYRRDRVGQALRSRRTGLLGLVTPWAEPELVDSVCAVARSHGYQVLVQRVAEASLQSEVESLQLMCEWRVEGVLWLPYTTSERAATMAGELSRSGVHPVLLQRDLPPGCPGDAVTADFRGGLYTALDHVRSQGYREVVYVHQADAFEPRQNRLAWFHQLAPQHFERHCTLAATAADFESRIRTLAVRPATALIVDSHWLGISLIRQLRIGKNGSAITPSMICLRDMRIGGNYLVNELITPPITSLELPLEAIGKEGVRLLAERCSGNAANTETPRHSTIRVPMPLHIRATTPAVTHHPTMRVSLS